MPIYTYTCGTCGRDRDEFNKVADRDNMPDCCGAAMSRKLTACMVSVPGGTDIDYKCPVTGEVVQTMRKRQYIMEQNGLVDARDLQDTWKRRLAADKAEREEIAAVNNAIPEAVKQAAMATIPPAGA